MAKSKASWIVLGLLASATPLAHGQPKASGDAVPVTAPANPRQDKADRIIAAPSAEDHLNARTDRELAAAVRQAILRDNSLSTYAHNVKIIVKDGSLTLRGPVRSGDEKVKVADLARQAAGTEKVNDQMSIEKSGVTRRKGRPDG